VSKTQAYPVVDSMGYPFMFFVGGRSKCFKFPISEMMFLYFPIVAPCPFPERLEMVNHINVNQTTKQRGKSAHHGFHNFQDGAMS
jgi:hypothetical protein